MIRAKATLKYVVWPADFRRSEATLFKAVPASVRNALRGTDCVCFVSSTGSQVLFVYKPATVGIVKAPHKRARRQSMLSSHRLRLNRGRFSPEMLQNYAGEVGLELVGLPRFEESFAAYQARRAA